MPPIAIREASILGLPIHLSDDYSTWLLDRLQHGEGVHVVTLNAEMAIQAEQNQQLAEVIRKAELIVPDGAGAVLYLRLRGKRVQRCPGIELAETVLRRSTTLTQPCSIFFYGGQPDVNERAVQHWRKQLPNATINTRHGYISPEEQSELLNTLATTQPNIILVGLGVPRQEFWISTHRHLCPNALWIGVGGSFDIWAGEKERAPGWLRNNHLEWVYRLYQEPWRWRRMMALPKFAWRALVHL
jgi:N-acetylglucosaminyldiphosphoundecaprenol N-acetyl-beta-D-mannosaminyltransferase